jgi:hypothetical protein
MSGRTFTDEELDALAKSLRDFNEMPFEGGALIESLHGMASDAADAIAFFRVGGWRTISENPPRPIMAEVFCGRQQFVSATTGETLPPDPGRDCRRSLAIWDGETWRELMTGHEYNEWRDDDSNYPTHYRLLPPAPEAT